jgi:phage gp46-like protein
MATYTDLAYEKTSDGLFDLVIDADNRDLALTDALDSALFVSLFSDRRAYPDEVIDPMKRRGWIGDLVSRIPEDRHGSGLWLYEQRRIAPNGASGRPAETATGIRIEAEAALDWMIEETLITGHIASVDTDMAGRTLRLTVSLSYHDGDTTTHKFALAGRTQARSLVSAG